MNDYKQGMGQRIKKQRKAVKLTQERIAEELNISVKHFSEVERGIAGLSVENLIKLSDILGVSIDYMVKGEADFNRWYSVINALDNVPPEKEMLIRNLLNTGIELAKQSADTEIIVFAEFFVVNP